MEAAVSVYEGSLGAVVEKLRLLSVEWSRIKGVRSQVGFLISELASMHALLRKVAAMEDPDIQVKAWAREVREMAYDIEDCVDAFTHRLGGGDEPHGQGGIKEFFGKCARFLLALRSWHQFADQIDELKSRVVEVGERRERYKLDDLACGNSGSMAVDPRLSALFADEDKLVGIDGPRNDLAKWMVEGESGLAKHRKVLSIVGFGGLGKTTLANEVYRKIGDQFQCKAFVSVSQKIDTNKVLRDFLIQLAEREPKFIKGIGAWDERKIITKTREFLQDKRYLVIIDDIWSTSAWDTIKCALPENNCSSRIVVTTRIFDVARSCCSGGDDRLYEMEPLSEFHSKRLFFGRIFGGENCCPPMLREDSTEILKKCGGLPLAIISISGLLANRAVVKDEWEKVKKSIGFALDKNQSLEGMKCILSLSYNDLPHYLKTCLLYLSTFPEDYVIERCMLVRRWIAEGFISEERGQNQQEVAESYFYELINKSMVQPVGIGYDGKARGCRVHDVMLELIISKATEENFITLLAGQTAIQNPHGSIRRLSIHYTDQQLAAELANKDLRHARSLTCFRSIKWLPRLVQFEALRVLVFENCEGLEDYDLESIDKLFQLKYLSLMDTRTSNLPAQIEKLEYLETLDLRGTSIRELPAGFFQLTKLLHLLGKYGMKIPDGIGNMTNLQVLTGIGIYQSPIAAVEELGELTSLKELEICLGSADTSDHFKRCQDDVLFVALCKLGTCKLQSLSIYQHGASFIQLLYHWSPPPRSLQRFYMDTSYYFPNVPKWIQPGLTNLAYLDLNYAS